MYKYIYETPREFSNIIMISDGKYLTELSFINSEDKIKYEEKNLEIFKSTCKWLDIYFSGKDPEFTPRYKIKNLTPFRKEVIDILNTISYGNVLTYNDIAIIIAKKQGIKRMSAQAVGGVVGWYPICLIIPCHRVIGTNNRLVGYRGGINNKLKLLKLEEIDISKFK